MSLFYRVVVGIRAGTIMYNINYYTRALPIRARVNRADEYIINSIVYSV